MTHRPPEHLQPDAAEFWRQVQHDYGIVDPPGLALLTSACELLDRAAEARRAIEQEGVTYTDRFGAPRTRPEVAVERNAVIAFGRTLKVLGLDLQPPQMTANRRR